MDFQSIHYVDPFAPLPTGFSQAGVLVTMTDPPPKQVAYARLVANKEPIGYGAGTATAVQVLPAEPLVPGVAYLIEVQYDRADFDPEVMNWKPHKGVVYAPVVVQRGRIDSIQVDPDGLLVSWETAATSLATGGYLQVVDLTGNQLTGAEYLGTAPSAALPATFTAGRSYGVRISAALPVAGVESGGFAAPYSFGPPTQPQPIPTAAPVLTALSCTAGGAAAQWAAPPVPADAAPARYELLLLDGERVIGSAPAGATGGQLATGELAALAAPRLAARVSYGSFVGPVGAGVALYPTVPQILSVTVTGSSPVTITAELAGPATLPSGGVLLATLYRDGVPDSSQTLASSTGSVSWPDVPVVAGAGYQVDVSLRVEVDGAQSLGTASPRLDVIVSAPVISSGVLDGAGRLSLQWSPGEAAGVTCYRLTATPETGQPASLQVTGTSFDGPVPAAFGAPGSLTVTPLSARCTGPSATARVLAAVAVTAADYADGQLRVTADLSGAQAGDTSRLEVLVNGAVLAQQLIAGPANPPFAIPVALPTGSSAAVRIGIDGPGTLAPPGSAPALPTRVPAVLDAGYDGSALHVRWTPTGEPGVTGYLVSVAGTGVPDSYVPGADSAAVAVPVSLDYPFPGGVSAGVRAVAGAPGSGSCGLGQPSAGRAPSLARSCYTVTVDQAGQPPYLYRRGVYQAQVAVAGQPIVLYLPKPFSGADNPTVPASGSPVFQLVPRPGAELPYQLTIAPEAWAFGASPVRGTLRTAYNSFLTAVEAAGVTPWAIGLLRQLIAQAMPQTFEEVLFYRYGYWHSDSLRVVDLMPGTRLQLAGALYQAPVGTTNERNGFTATGTEIFDVVDAVPQGGASTLPPGAGRILSVDALLSLVYPGSGAGRAGRPVAAGPLDFFADNNRQSYYRLFYPASFPASSSNGNPALTSNVTLVGTTSWTTLDAVTTQYEATNTFPTSQSYFATYFRGRAGLTPLVNVGIQGESRWVALGTSVRQALSSIGLAPYWGGSGGDLLSLLRASANLFANPDPDGGLALDRVDLAGTGLNGLTPLYWPLDMPLVGGDQLSVSRFPAAGGPA